MHHIYFWCPSIISEKISIIVIDFCQNKTKSLLHNKYSLLTPLLTESKIDSDMMSNPLSKKKTEPRIATAKVDVRLNSASYKTLAIFPLIRLRVLHLIFLTIDTLAYWHYVFKKQTHKFTLGSFYVTIQAVCVTVTYPCPFLNYFNR